MILLKLFPKIGRRKILPNTFYETKISLILKPEKDHKKSTDQYPL